MKNAQKVLDIATDMLDKVQTPRSRGGHVMERAAKLRRGTVDAEVVAMQMIRNSPNGHVYTAQGVQEMANAYQDAETRVILTAKQTTALLEDQAQVRRVGDVHEAGFAAQPA